MMTWQEQLRANLEQAATIERSPNLIRATDKEDALLVHAVLTLDEQPEAVSRVIDDVVGRVAALIKEAAPHDDAITRAVEWHLLQCGDDLMADWPRGHIDVVDRYAALLAAPPDDGSIGEPFLSEWQERKQAWSTSYPKMDGHDAGAIQRALSLLSFWNLEQGREPRERERLLLMHGEWGMRFPKPFMYAGNSGPSPTDFAAYRNKAIADHRLRMETPGVIEHSVEHREDANLRLLIGCFIEWECDRILEHAARSALALEDDEIAKSKDALKKLIAALATDRDDVDDPWGELDKSNPLRRPRGRAKNLWPEVREQLEQDKAKQQRLESTHPALVYLVHIDVVGILRPGLSIRDDYVVDTDGRQRMMFTQSQALDVPTVEMGALPRLLSRGLELFGSIQTHRIVRHVIKEGHRRAITGEADPRVLRYQGGWSALATQANVTEADSARAIVVALAHAAHEMTDGTHGNLLAYTARRGAPGRPGLVSLTLGDMLLPHFVHSLNQSKARTPTENRRLVPIVDFAGFVGRNNDHAAQATLQMMFMARLRDAAAELAATGTVRITDVEFAALAHDAGLIPGLLPRVIDRWTHHGGDAPAFMVKEGDRYTLAPHFAPALAFLEAAGRISLERSKAGKLSAARKGKQRRKKPAAS